MIFTPNIDRLNRNVQTLEQGDTIQPVTKVIINYGTNENGATLTKQAVASVDNGRTIELSLSTIPDGDTAQTIANNLLTKYSGDQHEALSIFGTELSPLMELGDGVSVNYTSYSDIGNLNVNFSKAMYTDVESQGVPEDDDFPYLSSLTNKTERDLATLKASIKVASDKIALEVLRATEAEGTLFSNITLTAQAITSEVSRATEAEGTLSSQIQQNADNILLRVEKNGVISAINQSAEQISISASKINLSGYLTISAGDIRYDASGAASGAVNSLESEMSAGTTVINGGCISANTLAISSLLCKGDSINIKNSNGSNVGYLGYGQGYDGSSYTTGVIIKANDTHYVLPTNAGVRMQSGSNYFYISNNYTVFSPVSYGALSARPSGIEGAIYFAIQ